MDNTGKISVARMAEIYRFYQVTWLDCVTVAVTLVNITTSFTGGTQPPGRGAALS